MWISTKVVATITIGISGFQLPAHLPYQAMSCLMGAAIYGVVWVVSVIVVKVGGRKK